MLSFPLSPLSFPFFLADFSSIHPVIGTWHAVCFFSSFLASLPQPFHKCLLPLSLPYFPLLFRFLSSASFPVPTTQPSASSFPALPCFASRWLFKCSALPFGPSNFLPFFLSDFSFSLPGSQYSVFCWFPFVLPCFTPAAVSQVITFCFRLRCFSFASAFFRPLLL